MRLPKRLFFFKRALSASFAVCAVASAFAAFILTACADMTSVPTPTMTVTASKTLYAPTWPEYTVDDDGNAVSDYSKRYYTVTQGRKRKISLSWNPVEIAKYYQIYAAKNINDEFIKVGESKTASFEDSVGSGSTYYYKVRAVNSSGETSDFSSVVRGTSLATPAINNIEITSDLTAKIFWYMGNAGTDSYVKDLIYEIHAFKGSDEKVVTVRAWDEANSSVVEECEFEGLHGNADYEFQVSAYVSGDTSQMETSPKVSQTTLSQYTPVSPEFTASQGESVDGVKLLVTLPSMVQVSTKKTGETEYQDIDYPLCFEIQRKRNGEEWPKEPYVVDTVYFTGTNEKPALGDYSAYTEGGVMEYNDLAKSAANSVARGVKYDYRIISYIDLNFSAVNGYEYDSTVGSKASIANVSTGWAAAQPQFKVKNFSKTLNDDKSAVLNASLGFDASWNDLGKAQDYKFAVQQNRRKFDSDNGGLPDEVGTDSWITDTNGNVLVSSIESVCAITKFYDLTSSPESIRGTYRYTLYVIPAKYTDISLGSQYPLAAVRAANVITVNDSATAPALDLAAEGGWTDHTSLSWVVEEGVIYSIDWEKCNSDGTQVDSGIISSAEILNGASEYTGAYTHYVEGGYEYRYNLKGNGYSGDTVSASTLGTPVLAFSANSYTDITVSWPQVVAAEEYGVTLGTSGSFGNGTSFVVAADGIASGVPDGLNVISNYDDGTKTISLTMQKPYGYNNAALSGRAVPLVVTALSEFDADNHRKGSSAASKDVWTVGPAASGLKATESFSVETNRVTVSWTRLEGAAGYAVYRMRPEMKGSTKADGSFETKDASIDVYYVNAEGTSIAPNAGAKVSLSGDTYTLTDEFKKAASASAYDVNQQYLALGIPFTYTVLPVLSSSDAASVDSMDEIALAGEPYANLASVQKDGYTTGYGIALEATKAEYSDKVVLSWDLPPSAKNKGKTPTIWYRKKGSSDAWTDSGKIFSDSSTAQCEFTPTDIAGTSYDDSIQALEYAVTYGGTMAGSSEKDVSYVEYLSDKYNKNITEEEIRSVGYMFTLPAITYETITSSNEKYSEEFNWHLYKHDNDRVVGNDITEYSLTVKNLNCSADDWPVYTYNASGASTAKGSDTYSWYDITQSTSASDSTVTVTIAPGTVDQSANTGTHDGLLKVQRDYKHNYKISASRTNSQGDLVTATKEATLYRKITNDEFAKCVTLIMADSLHQKGGAEGTLEGAELSLGVKGTFKVSTSYNSRVYYEYYYEYNNYKANFGKVPGLDSRFASGFILNASKGSHGSCYSNNTYGWGKNTVTVTHDSGLNSYQGTLTLSCGIMNPWAWEQKAHWDLSLEYKNNVVSSSQSKSVSGNETEFKQWFPFALATNLGSSVTDGTNSSYPTMNGAWWEVRQK